MDVKKFLKANALASFALFSAAAFAASFVPLSYFWGGAGKQLTLLDAIAPMAVSFLGPAAGIISILLAKGAALAAGTSSGALLATIALFAPPLAAAYFFAKYASDNSNSRIIMAAIPLACMALFLAHPVGAVAWQYSLLWLIPAAIAVLPTRHLFLRSLGTTFTQHAIGGVVWIYLVNALTPQVWLGLIPQVMGERLVLASAMSAGFLAVSAAVERVKAMEKAPSANASAAPLKSRKE